MVVGTWGALRSPLLDVDAVEVAGSAYVDPALIVEASGVASGTALIDVDADVVARRVEELAWVERAEVRRAWPASIVISVTERRPVAVTREDATSWALLDAGGRLLSRQADRPVGLIEIEGVRSVGLAPGDIAGGAGVVIDVAARLPGGLAARVTAVVGLADGIALRLAPEGVVRLGSADRLGEKLRALETVLVRVDVGGLVALDLSDPTHPALTRG